MGLAPDVRQARRLASADGAELGGDERQRSGIGVDRFEPWSRIGLSAWIVQLKGP